ncbi:MAG: hypothetical protein AAB547_01190 [Patescibacteria group bacterium]
MKAFYFIGASGVGKSTLCSELSKDRSTNTVFEELDRFYLEYKSGNISRDEAKDKTEKRVAEIEKLIDNGIYLVDVGSFAQKLDLRVWRKRSNQLIYIKNDINFCYANYHNRVGVRMDFEKWEKSEFSSERRELYSLAEHTVDGTGLDILTTKQKVLEIISKVQSSTA